MAEKKPVRFPKKQILTFKRYFDRTDLVTAILDDQQEYSVDEVDKLIDNFMKGKVR